MGQPPVGAVGSPDRETLEDLPLPILPANLAGGQGDNAFVVVVRTRDELEHWLGDPSPGLQWIQVEDLIGDAGAWVPAARGNSDVPLDVVLSDPAAEFSHIYRLVDVFSTRDVRVTIPAAPGFLKALRLAASLHLSVRLLPGQPTAEVVEELEDAADFYLHDPMVETPVEFFHSTLAAMHSGSPASLWRILEVDPAVFSHHDTDGNPMLPAEAKATGSAPPGAATFVESHLAALIAEGAECARCPWQQLCRGFFKQPDPSYSCESITRLFDRLRDAASEIGNDLARSGSA